MLYVNSDSNGRGFFGAGGNHDLQHFVNGVANDVTDPETDVSIGERMRAQIRVAALAPGANERVKAEAKIAADPDRIRPSRLWDRAPTIPLPRASGPAGAQSRLWRRRQSGRRLSLALRHL